MTEEWHSDIAITDALVKACLEEQFPELAPISEIKYVSEGWDNTVFLVNKHFIFRFPRRAVAAELIERENTLLINLHKLVDIEIPQPIYLGKPTSHYPHAFHGYTFIEGIPSYQAHTTMPDRMASLPILAKFLKQLHGIDETQALKLGAATQVWDRTNTRVAIPALTERVNKLTSRKFCTINQDCFQQELIKAQELSLPKNNQCLVHGDLDFRHLLFKEKKLSGIIDWGDTGINNRAVDLAIIWGFYPADHHKHFFDIYGEVDPATWNYARFLGLYSAFTLILYGMSIGDTLMASEAIAGIKRINSGLLSENT